MNVVGVLTCIPVLRCYAYGLLDSRHDANDPVQDCLVRALSTLQSDRDEADYRLWLFTCGIYLLITYAVSESGLIASHWTCPKP